MIKRFGAGPVLAVMVWPALALAQVPTTDAARLTQEAATASCMLRARAFKDQALPQNQGIKGSFVAPGSGGSASTIGSAPVLSGPVPGSTMGGIDLGAVTAAGGAGAMNVAAFGQALAAINAVAGAVHQNSTALTVAGQIIGTTAGSQGAWDQNSASRLGQAALWNQALQATSVSADLRHQRLMLELAALSKASKIFTFDPGVAAALVSGGAASGTIGLAP